MGVDPVTSIIHHRVQMRQVARRLDTHCSSQAVEGFWGEPVQGAYKPHTIG